MTSAQSFYSYWTWPLKASADLWGQYFKMLAVWNGMLSPAGLTEASEAAAAGAAAVTKGTRTDPEKPDIQHDAPDAEIVGGTEGAPSEPSTGTTG